MTSLVFSCQKNINSQSVLSGPMLDHQEVPLTSPSMEVVVQVEKGDREKLRRANLGLAIAWAACLALGRSRQSD